MSNHSSVVGGSSASRVINCPASVKLSEGVPNKTSTYAAEGTALHAVMEYWLERAYPEMMSRENCVGVEFEGVTVTQELFVEKLFPAVCATVDAFKQYGVTEFEPEGQVFFQSSGLKGAFGTCDVFATNDSGDLILLDYKFGDGVLVSPVENKQLMFYAAAALEDPTFKDWVTGDLNQRVVLGIIQPAQDPPLQVWETTVRDLAVFTSTLTLAVAAADSPDVEPRKGDWCRWCPAAPTCPAHLDTARRAAKMSKQDVYQLSVAMDLVRELEPWFKQVKAEAHEQLELGRAVTGYKLVPSRASRKWVDNDAVQTKLKRMKKLSREDYEIVKMVSPPQLEKVCNAAGVDFAQFSDYYTLVSSGTTLTTEDDPREGVVLQADRAVPEALAKAMKQHKN